VNVIKHDADKPITQGWHLDKRISLAHIFTTVSFIIAIGAIMWAIEARVTKVEQAVITHTIVTDIQVANLKEDAVHEQRLATERFGEIKQQLIRIENKVDRHAESVTNHGGP